METKISMFDVLNESGVEVTPHEALSNVFVTQAGQIVGGYKKLNQFKTIETVKQNYYRWESHHIVEKHTIEQLGIADKFTGYDYNLCVLLPRGGHRGRLNSAFRELDLINPKINEVIEGYIKVYQTLGGYASGGEAAVERELLQFVFASLRLAGLGAPSPAALNKYKRKLESIRSLLKTDAYSKPSDIFSKSLNGAPLVGGFLLGALAQNGDEICCKTAELHLNENVAEITLTIIKDKIETVCAFKTTADQLWTALCILNPEPWMAELTGVGNNECHLVDGQGSNYTCHPALMTSPVGEAMIDVEQASLAYFLRNPLKERPSSIQWYDAAGIIGIENGLLSVESKISDEKLTDFLLRLRVCKELLQEEPRRGEEDANYFPSATKDRFIAMISQNDWRFLQIRNFDLCFGKNISKPVNFHSFNVDHLIEIERMRRNCSSFGQVELFVKTLALLRWMTNSLGLHITTQWKEQLPHNFHFFSLKQNMTIGIGLKDVGINALELRDTSTEQEIESIARNTNWFTKYFSFSTPARVSVDRRVGTEKLYKGKIDKQQFLLQILEESSGEDLDLERLVRCMLFTSKSRYGELGWALMREEIAYDNRGRLKWSVVSVQDSNQEIHTVYRLPKNKKLRHVVKRANKFLLGCVYTPWNSEAVPHPYGDNPFGLAMVAILKGEKFYRELINKKSTQIKTCDANGGTKTIVFSSESDNKYNCFVSDHTDHETSSLLVSSDNILLEINGIQLEPIDRVEFEKPLLPPLDEDSVTTVRVVWGTCRPKECDVLIDVVVVAASDEGALCSSRSRMAYRRQCSQIGRRSIHKPTPTESQINNLLEETGILNYNSPSVRKLFEPIKNHFSSPMLRACLLEHKISSLFDKNYLAPHPETASEAAVIVAVEGGDCRHSSLLLTACMRACGIPACVKHGQAFNVKDAAAEPHCWVEAWVGGAWYIFDSALNYWTDYWYLENYAEDFHSQDAFSPNLGTDAMTIGDKRSFEKSAFDIHKVLCDTDKYQSCFIVFVRSIKFHNCMLNDTLFIENPVVLGYNWMRLLFNGLVSLTPDKELRVIRDVKKFGYIPNTENKDLSEKPSIVNTFIEGLGLCTGSTHLNLINAVGFPFSVQTCFAQTHPTWTQKPENIISLQCGLMIGLMSCVKPIRDEIKRLEFEKVEPYLFDNGFLMYLEGLIVSQGFEWPKITISESNVGELRFIEILKLHDELLANKKLFPNFVCR